MVLLAFVSSYLIGSTPTAYLIGKWTRGIDIRQHGSGNVGATNVFRTVGRGWGSVALIGDMGKGFLVTYFAAPYFFQLANPSAFSLISFQLLLGLLAIAGHTWPVWLKFHGGKGVATSCGVFLGIYPKAVLLALAIWILVAFLSRYVSLSSIIAAFSFSIWLFVFYRNSSDFFLSLVISVVLFIFIVWTHRKNISRLFAGTESKIGSRNNS